jgi:hypothetical protein
MEFKRIEVSHSTTLMRVVRSVICYLGLHTISKAVCVGRVDTHLHNQDIPLACTVAFRGMEVHALAPYDCSTRQGATKTKLGVYALKIYRPL